MITQKYKQNNNEIKIETAENLEDAKQNKFADNQYTKIYINGKLTNNYMAMIRFIVDESKKNNKSFIPTENLEKLRQEMFDRQNKEIADYIEKMKQEYAQMNIPERELKALNDAIDKINPVTGLREKK